MSAIRITNFSMRPAVVPDIPTTLLLLELSLNLTPSASQQKDVILRRAKRILKAIVPEGKSYIASIEGDIIGFGGWTMKTNLLPTPPLEDDKGTMFLLVHPRWRRRGIGKQLIKVCELTARQASIEVMLMLLALDASGVARSVQYMWLQDANIHIDGDKSIQLSWYKKSLI